MGSSPRIRGEWGADHEPPPRAGIIPANTGRIMCWFRWPHRGRDHPREYGENHPSVRPRRSERGSSPRIRGESVVRTTVPTLTGIIPANTGRIWLRSMNNPGAADHPREYGENWKAATSSQNPSGSSPRIRGESRSASISRTSSRIIPANTGRIP